jgi:hypothetical protein
MMTRKFQKIISGTIFVAFAINKLFFNFGYTPTSLQIDMFITTMVFCLFGNISSSDKEINSDGFSINFGSKKKNNIAFIAVYLQTILMIYNFNIGNFATNAISGLSMTTILLMDILKY